jgi:hypothetical protein
MNRITFPPAVHPFDEPLAAHRLGALRTLCQVMIGALIVITLGVWMVVWKVFGGEPLAGNLVTVGGVSALTWACGAITLVVAPLVVWVGRKRGDAGVRQLKGARGRTSTWRCSRGRRSRATPSPSRGAFCARSSST